MEMNKAIDVLERNGIKTSRINVRKNGKDLPAVTIGNGRISPTLYQETFDDIYSENEIVRFARQLLTEIPEYNFEDILTREFVLRNVRSCVRHATCDPDTVKFPVFGDLEEYFRVAVPGFIEGSHASVVVLEKHLCFLGIDKDELRTAARTNSRRSMKIMSMTQILSEFMDDDGEIPDCDVMMYVASNDERLHGASAMLMDDMLEQFCKDHGWDSIYIIPSSIHEVILIRGNVDKATVDSMVVEVNESQVKEDERLSDHCYLWTLQ